jgi:succinate dehydrogenase / fumarate reductase cytochrome b subunit
MAEAKVLKERPGPMRLADATQYKLPPSALVSILHRISGLIIAILLPFVIWLFDKSLSSEISFDEFRGAFIAGIGFVPAFVVKLVTLVLLWSFLHHFCAGLRHLYLDVTHNTTKEVGRSTALGAMGVSLVLTVALGAKLFGLY